MAARQAGGGGRGGGRAPRAVARRSCGISPDNKFFVDVYQTHDQPPATQVVDMTGKVVAQVAKSDMTKFEKLGLKKVEMFTYLAADGKTTLYGTISFPSNFDPTKKYPALASVYGGPGSAVTNENFMRRPSTKAEYGFLMLQLSSRSAPGRGKAILDQSYMKLGITEMADMAEGVKALWSRPVFRQDARRHFRHVVRRLQLRVVAAEVSRRLGRRVRVVGRDVLVSLRLHLHRAVYVDSAGEQGRL